MDFSPEIVLKDILKIANEQQKKFSEIFEKNLLPELKKNGIQILSWHHLNKEQIEFVDTFFNENLLPFVQPVILAEKKIKPFDIALYYIDYNAKSRNSKIKLIDIDEYGNLPNDDWPIGVFSEASIEVRGILNIISKLRNAKHDFK